MSFILDALRKSEHERQRHSGPTLSTAPAAASSARAPWIFLSLGFLLALNLLGLVAFWMWRDSEAPAPSDAPSHETATAPLRETPTPSGPPAARVIRPLTDESIPAAAESPQPAAPAAPPEELLPQPAAGSPVLPSSPAQPPSAPRPSVEPAGVPTIDQLDATATAGLPVLNLDLHVYVADPAKRFVFINGTRYGEGATLKEGPTVERITRDGAVLNHRGVRFLLERP